MLVVLAAGSLLSMVFIKNEPFISALVGAVALLPGILYAVFYWSHKCV